MGTRNFLVIKVQFDHLLHESLLNRALFGKMVGVVGSVLGCFFCVLGFLARYLLRFIGNEYDQGSEIRKEGEDEDGSVSSASKYEFLPLRGINGFVEEPKAVSFTVHELYLDSDDVVPKKAEEELEDSVEEESLTRGGESSEKSTGLNDSVPETLPSSEEFVIRYNEIAKRQEQEETLDVPETFLGSGEFTFHFAQIVPETFLEIARVREHDDQAEDGSSEKSKALTLSEKLTFHGEQYDQAYEFTRREDEPSEETEALTFAEFPVKIALTQEEEDEAEDSSSQKSSLSFTILDDKIIRELDEQAGDFAKEAVESEDSESPFENREDEDDKAVESEESESPFENREDGDDKAVESEDAKSPFENHSSFDEEDDDIIIDPHSKEAEGEYIELKPRKEEEEEKKPESESEWEHNDVIEQLKWELRKARAGGLATIMEEEESGSDSPVASPVGVVPGKVDLSIKFGYKESMEEIQKVHKTYAERMRKLDILNTQTMHAIGFLQLKHQPKPTQKQKKIFLPRRAHKNDDPAIKYAGKLQNDFELVYVGQICLSWEMLTWQRRKLRDHSCLHNNVARRYNLVASEFQLFRVLIQRFVEDESFRGPRVQNYTKSRCVIRSLVQVPIVRDDFAKDKQYVLEGDEDSVSCERLSRVIVEAMFAFWDFVRRDEKSNVGVRVSKETLIGEAVDSKLLMDIKRDFQKKERKVKDIERSGNCVVKKLQKWHKEEEKHKERDEEEEDDEFLCEGALFLAQVELRLVSRVLSMSTLTRDRLLWCQHKLNQITFSNRKLHFEPSFLLFPC